MMDLKDILFNQISKSINDNKDNKSTLIVYISVRLSYVGPLGKKVYLTLFSDSLDINNLDINDIALSILKKIENRNFSVDSIVSLHIHLHYIDR